MLKNHTYILYLYLLQDTNDFHCYHMLWLSSPYSTLERVLQGSFTSFGPSAATPSSPSHLHLLFRTGGGGGSAFAAGDGQSFPCRLLTLLSEPDLPFRARGPILPARGCHTARELQMTHNPLSNTLRNIQGKMFHDLQNYRIQVSASFTYMWLAAASVTWQ